MKCKHTNYSTSTSMEFRRVAEDLGALRPLKFTTYMVAKIKMKCAACGKSFTFTGQTGYSPTEATVSEALDELRIPVNYPSGEEEEGQKGEEESGQLLLPLYIQ